LWVRHISIVKETNPTGYPDDTSDGEGNTDDNYCGDVADNDTKMTV
jgi:hypothetical protein